MLVHRAESPSGIDMYVLNIAHTLQRQQPTLGSG